MGFCQYYPYALNGEDWQGAVEAGGTYSIDYLLGEPDCLGRGYCRAMVRLLLDAVAREAGARRVIAQPDPENAASCRTLLSAGFVYDGENRLYLYTL